MADHTALIHIKELKRQYRMGDNIVRALDGVNLQVANGDFVMIVGGSGSGKSTLMHLFGLLDVPTSGRFEINGENIGECSDARLSLLRNRHIGFVFQQFNLLNDLSIVENIALPLAYSGMHKHERRRQAVAYATTLGLETRLHHLPSELSGGQMQRVAIARALVNRPDILLADEPTGNLDSKTSREIMQVLYDLHAKGHTIIMVTHDPKLADQGTRKVTISDGKIVDDSPGVRQRSLSTPQPPSQEQIPRESGGLGWLDLLRIGVKEGLMTHGTRTFLTMLGIIIGVSSVIAMSSFSLGSKQKQADQIRALGANLVRIVDRRLENERLTSARIQGSLGLNQQDLETIRENIPQISQAACLREIKLNVLSDEGPLNPRILGVEGDYLAVNNLTLSRGRFFDTRDASHSSKVTVIGSDLASQLGGAQAVGRTLLLGGTPYIIIGILADKNIQLEELEATSISNPNNDLLIPLNTLLARTAHLDLRSEFDEIQLQLTSEDELYTAGRAIKRILEVIHNGVNDYDMVIPMDLLKQKQQSQHLLDILTACISSISIVVGGIGIMNIMLASVTERIREIGIRRAIGATTHDILFQFLSESMIISVTGGILGVGLAFVVVVVTCHALSIPVVFSWPLLVIAVVASTATGLIFGLYPAYQAANKNPVEALRYE
jgi:macrolide transport system ATP-binding/permease protein